MSTKRVVLAQEDGQQVDWYSLSKQPSEVRGLWHLYFMARFRAEYPEDALQQTNTLALQDNSYPDSFGVKRVLVDLTDELVDGEGLGYKAHSPHRSESL